MQEREHATKEMGDWLKAHQALLQMARERSALEGREGQGLLCALRSNVHLHLGYGSFVEYVERLFGFAPRTTLDKLRTAEALERLPELARALASGEARWSAVRELARVATAETEREWLEASKGRTVRDIERLVAGREPGDRPSDPARACAERHVLRFEVAAETLATFREAMKALRQQSGGHLDDDAALLLMARNILGSRDGHGRRGSVDAAPSNDAGRASYQLAFVVCERCQRGFQEADGERIGVEREIVEMMCCDAQHIGYVGGTQAVPEMEAEVHHTHVGLPKRLVLVQRATQTIPPAVRRYVLARDSGRCVVPGCRHATFVDLHHVVPRAEGGRHDADNLVVLCGAHHRAVHRGCLVMAGGVSAGLIFRHADGTAYGMPHVPSPHTIATLDRVFCALRGLGFKEHEAREALDAVMSGGRDEVLSATPTAEELLRAALRALAPRSTRL